MVRCLLIFGIALIGGCSSNSDKPVNTLAIVNTCITCHGPEGKSAGDIPSIYGLSESEIVRAFEDFAMGEREATVMDRIVGAYSDEEIQEIARYFAGLSGKAGQ